MTLFYEQKYIFYFIKIRKNNTDGGLVAFITKQSGGQFFIFLNLDCPFGTSGVRTPSFKKICNIE